MPDRTSTAPAEGVGDHVHVDVSGVADHPGADASAEQCAQQAGQFLVAGDANDDLGGVDAAGEVQERAGGVFACHNVVAAAEVLD
ncbi:hypothetical protein D9M72_562090 [compost metagenome]